MVLELAMRGIASEKLKLYLSLGVPLMASLANNGDRTNAFADDEYGGS